MQGVGRGDVDGVALFNQRLDTFKCGYSQCCCRTLGGLLSIGAHPDELGACPADRIGVGAGHEPAADDADLQLLHGRGGLLAVQLRHVIPCLFLLDRAGGQACDQMSLGKEETNQHRNGDNH